MKNIDVTKPAAPNAGKVHPPNDASIRAAVMAARAKPKEAREAFIRDQAERLVELENGKVIAWANLHAATYRDSVKQMDGHARRVNDDMERTDPTIHVHTNKRARVKHTVDDEEQEEEITRVPSERRSRLRASVLWPTGLFIETSFAANSFQEAGLFEAFDRQPGLANMLPFALASGAVAIVFFAGHGKLSQYRHYDRSSDRKAYREKLNHARNFWMPIWFVLMALIIGMSVGFSPMAARSSYPEAIKLVIEHLNLAGVVLDATLPVIMIAFLGIQAWAMGTIVVSAMLNEEHAYLKGFDNPSRANEDFVGQMKVKAEFEGLRLDYAETLLAAEAILLEVAAMAQEVANTITAEVEQINLQARSHAASAEAKILRSYGSRKTPNLKVVDNTRKGA